MGSRKEIKAHLQVALNEIGEVKPWWSDEDGMYVFEHEAYPMVMYADPDPEKVKAGYMRALDGFIQDRLTGQLAESVDRITSGRGGRREGAGRPPKEVATKVTRIPEDILDVVDWLKEDPKRATRVRQIMQEA